VTAVPFRNNRAEWIAAISAQCLVALLAAVEDPCDLSDDDLFSLAEAAHRATCLLAQAIVDGERSERPA
jgi:hypothetical protein